jgi:hypothetical protein
MKQVFNLLINIKRYLNDELNLKLMLLILLFIVWLMLVKFLLNFVNLVLI